MKISAVSYSLSEQPSTIKEWESKLTTEIQGLISDGSKVILYPEFFLMGLSEYFPGELKEQFAKISTYLETSLYTSLAKILKGKDICLCLGTGPRLQDGKIYNSSPVWVNDSWMFQDKIHLTPWEIDFTPGIGLNYFEFHSLQCAVAICFDIEHPGLALNMKRNGVDLLLVPSATTNKNGNQRVNRCASARSIELGAAVLTTPLVGDSRCELIDHGEGRQGFFMPAQEIVAIEQELFSEYSTNRQLTNHYFLEVEMMKELKKKDNETKPYLTEDRINP